MTVERRKKDSGYGTTWEKKKKRKTEAEMDGLCQTRRESYNSNPAVTVNRDQAVRVNEPLFTD